VLATVGSTTKSELEFWDLDFVNEDPSRREGLIAKDDWGNGIQLLGTADHYGVTDVEWDPSGRYLATSASAWQHTVWPGSRLIRYRGFSSGFAAGKWICDLGLAWAGVS
jgi:translation initiation factor 3 subunit B